MFFEFYMFFILDLFAGDVFNRSVRVWCLDLDEADVILRLSLQLDLLFARSCFLQKFGTCLFYERLKFLLFRSYFLDLAVCYFLWFGLDPFNFNWFISKIGSVFFPNRRGPLDFFDEVKERTGGRFYDICVAC